MPATAGLVLLCAVFPLAAALAGSKDLGALSLLKNAEYRLALGGQQVRLRNGVFQKGRSPDEYVRVVFDRAALGDLNGDGIDDAAVILVHTSMGSGAFHELVLMTRERPRFVQRRSILLGDRVHIRTLRVRAGMVEVVLKTHKETDAACCPTQPATRRYGLRGPPSQQSP
ncbi:MAG: hypothetical protein ACE147_08280 [Candidatus Methylomirabilales bacterium]